MTEEQINHLESLKSPSNEKLLRVIREQFEQQKHLIEALEFYSDEATYDISHLEKYGYIIIDKDGGERAHAALQQIQGIEVSCNHDYAEIPPNEIIKSPYWMCKNCYNVKWFEIQGKDEGG